MCGDEKRLFDVECRNERLIKKMKLDSVVKIKYRVGQYGSPPSRGSLHRRLVPFGVSFVIASVLAGCGSTTAASNTSSSVAATSAPAAHSNNLKTVSVAYMPGVSAGGELVASAQQGYFAKAGLKVNPVRFSSGPTEVDALASGKVNFAYLGPGALFLAAQHRAVIIGVTNLSSSDYVLTDSPGVTNVSQLKGQSVMVTEGTTGEMILYITLHAANLPLSSVHLVNAPPADITAAMASGNVHNVATWSPYANEIQAKEPTTRILGSDAHLYPKVGLTSVWVVSPSYLKAHPNTVEKFMEAELNANQYYITHMSQLVTPLAKFISVPSKIVAESNGGAKWLSSSTLVKDYSNGTVSNWLSGEQNIFIKMGLLKAAVPVSTWFDPKAAIQAGKADHFAG